VVSNVGRLYLVWRFVHIQPFNRHYFRLAIPGGAAAAIMLGVHTALSGGPWPVDLLTTAVAGSLVYLGVLLVAGLTPTERMAVASVLGRSGAS
jgi:hypothetical protein